MAAQCGPRLVFPCLTVVFFVCLETVLLCTESTCSKSFYVHWNTSNSIFRIDNTDHIIDVNKGNVKFEYDQVNIICPVYSRGTYDEDAEKYIIYNVSKEEYETCRITNPNPRIIAVCDKPDKVMYFTITFRPFTPQPGGLEFLPGNDYYFISTSSKDDLHRRVGGRCSTNNMKIVFKVCCAAESHQNTTHLFTPTTAYIPPPPIKPSKERFEPGYGGAGTIYSTTHQITTNWPKYETSTNRKPTKNPYLKRPHENDVTKSFSSYNSSAFTLRKNVSILVLMIMINIYSFYVQNR